MTAPDIKMKQLEILLFAETINMLEAFRGEDFDYDDEYSETLHNLLDTLSKCVVSDEYYELYREFNQNLLGKNDKFAGNKEHVDR